MIFKTNHINISIPALILLPNLLGLINIDTPFGIRIHFFQLAVIVSAVLYGPKCGLLSGLVGSLYPAIIAHNPYIIIGNCILGCFTGIFSRKMAVVPSVILAFGIQLPWLFVSDYFLMHLPIGFIMMISLSLLVSNLLWSLLAHRIKNA